MKLIIYHHIGGLAQMVERFVSNEEAKGSIPLISNLFLHFGEKNTKIRPNFIKFNN